jgi:molybdenum cofactor guanylyltransferase
LLDAWRRRPETVLMTTFRIIETGYVESLVAVYEPGGAALLREHLGRGEQRLSGIFSEDVRLHIDYSREDRPVARAFFNINSPPDLMRARVMEGPA